MPTSLTLLLRASSDPWIAAGAVFAATFLGTQLLSWLLRTKVRAAVDRMTTKFDDLIVDIADSLSRFLGFIIAVTVTYHVLDLSEDIDWWLARLTLVLLVLGTVRIASTTCTKFMEIALESASHQRHLERGRQTLPFIDRMLRSLLWVIAIVFLLGQFGVEVSSLVTGLGIGGIAIALGAQTTLANIFGSLMIFWDRPFTIGDTIVIDGQEGVVEDIGLRSTRVRLLDGPLLMIPNKQVAEAMIANKTKRESARVNLDLTFVYATPRAHLEEARNLITSVLRATPGIDLAHPPRVHLLVFGTSGVTYRVVYWIRHGHTWDEVLETQHRVNVAIKEGLDRLGVEFAGST